MNEKLKISTYINGTFIPHKLNPAEWGNMITGAYVWYNNNASMKDKNGGLFNWFTNINPNGLCTEGRYVPSNNTEAAWVRFLYFNMGAVGMSDNNNNNNNKLGGRSIRCLKD